MTNGSDQNPSQNVTKFLAGGIGSVSAAFGALGTLTGGLERAVRNYPKVTVALLLATAVIVGLGVIAPAVSKAILRLGPGDRCRGSTRRRRDSRRRRGQRRLDQGAAASQRQSGRDKRAADNQGLVEANGLKSDEHMLIRVEGRTTKNELAFFRAGKRRDKNDPAGGTDTEPGVDDHFQLIYAARVGPDEEGKIKAPIETVAAPKLYERIVVSAQVQGEVNRRRVQATRVQRCGEDTRYWGCAVLLVPAS